MLKYFYKKDNSTKGFTLIELLVVIAIIGVLASIVLASLGSARKKGRDARRIGDLRSVQLAMELYFDSNGDYNSTGAAISTWDGLGTMLSATNACGTGQTCIPAMPLDPLNSGSNVYSVSAIAADQTTSYTIKVVLEDSTNSALDSDVDGTSDGVACDDPSYCVKP